MDDYKEFFKAMEDSRDFEVEELYQAFKARLIDELKVSGNSNQGVVYGQLKAKKLWP